MPVPAITILVIRVIYTFPKRLFNIHVYTHNKTYSNNIRIVIDVLQMPAVHAKALHLHVACYDRHTPVKINHGHTFPIKLNRIV